MGAKEHEQVVAMSLCAEGEWQQVDGSIPSNKLAILFNFGPCAATLFGSFDHCADYE
jgi:hypothetical protein